ncbi:MAG TPA: ATP-dependent Zn protease [Oscillatoriaceae cyanobacterium M33_DOE_052]|uniref:ATP-dependent Zn protease n=1 Tax=Planktothricoides sp. SpSt-374 TaxID=2282167 RepID=A0A7C3VQ73_9CYAN|nr:ATP-dependent Zn protease [Oscillatoriaceae cyanobacterium M33_DOE_052]
MNQTSLNLIAITVFAITLSALVGPAFNLPPTVPAGITFILLGLATADTLAWQNQGITLLLDWFAQKSPEQQKRILHHEAGHFFVAYKLGIPITGYALNAWEAFKQGQSARGGVRFDDTELAAELQQGKISQQLLDRYCTMWMGGIAAEMLVYNDTEGGAEDRQKLRGVLSPILRNPQQVETKERWAYLQARSLIENNQNSYECLMASMAKRAPIDECYAAIEREV